MQGVDLRVSFGAGNEDMQVAIEDFFGLAGPAGIGSEDHLHLRFLSFCLDSKIQY